MPLSSFTVRQHFRSIQATLNVDLETRVAHLCVTSDKVIRALSTLPPYQFDTVDTPTKADSFLIGNIEAWEATFRRGAPDGAALSAN